MAKQYIVTAPLVITKREDGGETYVYEGGIVEGQDKEWVDHHLKLDMIAAHDGSSESDDDGGDEPPAGNASRDEWASYASDHGHDVTDEMSRDDIRALFA